MQLLDASFGQYLFDLFFYLILCFISWRLVGKRDRLTFVWLLIVAFCVLSFFAGDWFHYRSQLPYIDKNFSEPLYYYFAILSFRNYFLFRFLVWGCATLLFFYISKVNDLDQSSLLFVFILLFLPTFCYARASLAMSSYFLGLSLWANMRQKHFKVSIFITGSFFIVLSFFFHRSFLPIIALSPLVFFKFNRGFIVLLIILIPLFMRALSMVLNLAAEDSLIDGEEFEAFSATAQGYANQTRHVFNWKFTLISNLKHIGLYIPFIYILFRTKFSKHRVRLPRYLEKIFIVDFFIYLLATVFFLLSISQDSSDVLGYRFLYMTGIPTTVLMAYLLQKHELTKVKAFLLFFCTWLSTVGLILGKLLSL